MTYEVTRVSGGRRYRHLMDSVWDPVKKRSRPVYVRSLGRVEGQGRREHVTPTRLRVDSVDASHPVGALALWYALAEAWGLRDSIRGVVAQDVNEAADGVLALVLNQLTGRKPLDEVAPWVASSALSRWGLDPSGLSKDDLLGTLDAVCRVDDSGRYSQCLAVQTRAVASWRKRVGRDPAHAYYYQDVTRIRYNGNHCPLAERGYGAVATRPHVGFALVTGRKHQFPATGLPVAGSRPDVATVPETLEALDRFRHGRLTLVWDRGLVSHSNMGLARRAGHHVLVGVPATSGGSKAALARWPDAAIEHREGFLQRSRTGGIYVKAWPGRFLGHRGTWAVVLDPAKRTRDRSTRDALLQELLEGHPKRGRVSELRDQLGPLIVAARGRRGWRLDAQAEAADRATDGRSLFFTTDPSLDGVQIVRVYYQRDEVEKAFRGLRGEADLAPIAYRKPGRVEAYLSVVCYWAYLLRCAAQWTLRERGIGMSVEELVKDLDTVHEVRLRSGRSVVPKWTHASDELARVMKLFGIQKLET